MQTGRDAVGCALGDACHCREAVEWSKCGWAAVHRLAQRVEKIEADAADAAKFKADAMNRLQRWCEIKVCFPKPLFETEKDAASETAKAAREKTRVR